MPKPELSPERWQALQQAVDAALDLEPAERAPFLALSLSGDIELRAEAERLLAACARAEQASGLLAGSAGTFAEPLLASSPSERRADLQAALARALDGRYDVQRELGRGGMASVWLAWDRRHERTVAVKVLESSAAHGSAERFLREIRTTAQLTHPHVLTLYDSGEADGWPYYVMPYVEGETLRARLVHEPRLPVGEAVALLREIADALTHAHARGVVHRDLKPENVLLSGGHAVVMDFGIAKALAAGVAARDEGTALTSIGTVIGTPGYMAPEQALGDPSLDHRADLYALGVIGYEMLTGTQPFTGRTGAAVVCASLTETPEPVEAKRADVPAPVARLIMELLACDPAARPQSAEAVLAALARGGIDGGRYAPDDARPRATRARVVLRWGIAALVLLLLAAATRLAWQRLAPPGDSVRTLAVLPFENVGGGTDDGYFSDGMTDELAHALGRIPGVRLAGRTSSFAFKGKTVPAQEVGRALDVTAIIVGSVRRAGERIRVSTQLVSATDGAVLWDSIFESRTGDVFAVQDSLTKAMVAALTTALGLRDVAAERVIAVRGTADPEAYDLYQRGRSLLLMRGAENVAQSIRYYRSAIDRDPDFARAHAGLALAYGVLPVYVAGSSDSSLAGLEAHARRAVALDSTLGEAQGALGFAYERRFRIAEAERHYRAALRYEPWNGNVHHALGGVLTGLGRTEEALQELRLAAQLEPLVKSVAAALSTALTAAQRFEEAKLEARRALAQDSTFVLAEIALGHAQMFAGEADSAIVTLERPVARGAPLSGVARSSLVYAYAAAGRWQDAARVREEIRHLDDEWRDAHLAFAELVFGNREPAVRLLATRAGQGQWWWGQGGFGCNPMIDPLWTDARFRRVMRALDVTACPHARPWPFTPPRTR